MWATFISSVHPCASANARIPKQLDGCKSFIRKWQQTSTTCGSWSRQAAARRFSMVSSFNSRQPEKKRMQTYLLGIYKTCNMKRSFINNLSFIYKTLQKKWKEGGLVSLTGHFRNLNITVLETFPFKLLLIQLYKDTKRDCKVWKGKEDLGILYFLTQTNIQVSISVSTRLWFLLHTHTETGDKTGILFGGRQQNQQPSLRKELNNCLS